MLKTEEAEKDSRLFEELEITAFALRRARGLLNEFQKLPQAIAVS